MTFENSCRNKEFKKTGSPGYRKNNKGKNYVIKSQKNGNYRLRTFVLAIINKTDPVLGNLKGKKGSRTMATKTR
jgi:hypothetical protein